MVLPELERTRAMLLNERTNTRPHEDGLNLVVVRLLSLAVRLAQGRPYRGQVPSVAIPSGYRRWPSLSCQVDEVGEQSSLRLYVCPKAAATADDQSFPAGTMMVVEHTEETGAVPQPPCSIFVMGKVSSLLAQAEGCGSCDSWAFASYRSVSSVERHEATVSGLRRVPVGSF